jgi:nitroreductase
MQLVIQAESMGLKSHFMGGIVAPEIEKSLNITDHWVVCVIAIGKQTSIDSSSDELKARETAERTRLSADSVYSINQALN